jgi:mono/diheme cytochrome c family protein
MTKHWKSILTYGLGIALAGALVGTLAVAPSRAQSKKTIWDGVYTDAQADRGMVTFKAQCASCHGESMQGAGGAPGIAGAEFLFNWDKKSAGELLEYIKGNMPPGAGGSISDAKYVDIIAAMFKTSEFPTGSAELDAKSVGDIQITKEKK